MVDFEANFKEIKLQSLISLLANYRKQVLRFGLFLYLIPFVFFTIELGIIEKIDMSYLEISKTRYLRLFIPILYTLVFTVFALQNIKALKVLDEVRNIIGIKTYEDSWLDKLSASFIISYTMKQFSSSVITGVLFFLPLLLLIFFIPLGFIVYGIWDVYSLMMENNDWLSIVCFIVLIWLFIGSLFTWYQNRKLDIHGEPTKDSIQ